jgi:glycosyltransferase involved in cell wall biosynthesis
MLNPPGGGALLRISQGSFEVSVERRGAVNRVRGMDLEGYFSKVFLAFFKADEDKTIELSPVHRVLDIAGGPARGGGLGRLRAESHLLRNLRGLIRREGICAISANDPYLSGLNALILARLTGIPYVIEIVADYDLCFRVGGSRPMPYVPRPLEKAIERFVLRSADAVYADRQFYLRYALMNGARPERTHRVRCVTDPFYYRATPARGVEEYADVVGKRILFYAGRLHPEKNTLDLVDCLARVRVDLPDVVLLIAGDGPQRDEIEDRARSLGVRDAMILLGQRSPQELVDLMAGADVLLAPHAGYSLIEMALSGTPIVAYDYEWHPEVVRPGETGLLAPYRDAMAMAEGVLSLLANPGLGASLGAAAREFALLNQDWRGALDDERRLFERLLTKQDFPSV